MPRSRSEPSSLRPPDTYVVARSIDVRRYGDTVLIASLASSTDPWAGPGVIRLRGTSVATWDCIAQGRTVAQICAELATRFHTSPDAIAADVAAAVDDWVSAGFVERR